MIEYLDYPLFIDYVKEQINENDNSEVNGFEVIFDYYFDYPPDYLSDEDSEYLREELDNLVQEQISEIQNVLLKKESDWLEIIGEKWLLKTDKNYDETTSPRSKLYGKLSSKEIALLEKSSTEINDEERRIIANLYTEKVKKLGDKEEQLNLAKLISDKLVFTDNYSNEYNSFIILAGKLSRELNKKEAYIYFEHLAKIYRNIYEHNESAEWYNKAATVAKECSEDNEIVLNMTRNERLQFELAGHEERASASFVRENDLISDIDGRKITRIFYSVLKCLSDYCQNPKKVAGYAFGVIFISSIIFSITGITPSGGEAQSWLNGSFFSLKTIDKFGDSVYFSIVTFTTLGYGDYAPSNVFSRVIANFVSVSGLLLSSLFLATLVKRYGR